ncbi:MAG: mechanosensitive ion channel domain-containing protein [Solirubrobacteraceae bacterium]
MKQLFETRSHTWVDAGLARQVSGRALRRARLQILIAAPLLAGILVLYSRRDEFAGADTPIRAVTVVGLLMLGYAITRDAGRLLGPALFRRMDPPTAGTVGFLIRLVGIIVITAIALRIAGVGADQLAVGGAFTAIIAGLAAQQTLGNLFAGLVLLSARPFRVGDRVKLQGSGIEIEGVVSSLGLLYTSFDYGENTTMVPNSSVLNVAVTPLREPEAVDLKARLPSDVTPGQIEALLRENVETPLRGRPDVSLEEIDGDELVLRIAATPRRPQDGSHLASEVLEVLARRARN